MKRLLLGFRKRQWPRRFFSTDGPSELLPVDSAAPWSNSQADVEAFRQTALISNKPLLFQKENGTPIQHFQAFQKWFTLDSAGRRLLSTYMAEMSSETPFPYELLLPRPTLGPTAEEKEPMTAAVTGFRDWLLQSDSLVDSVLAGILQSAIDQTNEFNQFHAPLDLLLKALEFNTKQSAIGERTVELYVTQVDLGNLPQRLRDDVQVPQLLHEAGKGDLYGSSLWLGSEPVYTPLHRDPNPNLFGQLCGSKLVRLLPPATGDHVYALVQVSTKTPGNSRIRSTEMMEGKERSLLHEAVWGVGDKPHNTWTPHEAKLNPGDALFIPKGWWHSVKSCESDGQLNGSVNWWFR